MLVIFLPQCAVDPVAVSVKKRKRVAEPQDPGVTFSDFGGNEALLCDICMLLAHLKHPEMYR
jgi:ribosome biogenesis ATPase